MKISRSSWHSEIDKPETCPILRWSTLITRGSYSYTKINCIFNFLWMKKVWSKCSLKKKTNYLHGLAEKGILLGGSQTIFQKQFGHLKKIRTGVSSISKKILCWKWRHHEVHCRRPKGKCVHNKWGRNCIHSIFTFEN